jgi:hypothetical protein
MEKLTAFVAVSCAAVCAAGLFMLGRRALKCGPGATGWRRRFWLETAVVLAILSFATTGLTQDAPPKPDDGKPRAEQPLSPEMESKINDLVAKLGTDDITVRDNATAELIKVGLPARKAILAAAKSDDPEVRMRANRVLGQISITLLRESEHFKVLRARWQELTSAYIAQKETSPVPDGFEKAMEKISTDTGISAAFSIALAAVFKIRAEHIDRSFAGMTCYKMTMEGGEQSRAKIDIEDQFQLLEKMRASGKIDEKTFGKVKETIKGGLSSIYRDWESKKPVTDGLEPLEQDGLVNTMVELSGITPDGKIMPEPEKKPKDEPGK